MTKGFEVLHILIFWKKNLHRLEKVGFILKDYTERKSFGCTFDLNGGVKN